MKYRFYGIRIEHVFSHYHFTFSKIEMKNVTSKRKHESSTIDQNHYTVNEHTFRGKINRYTNEKKSIISFHTKVLYTIYVLQSIHSGFNRLDFLVHSILHRPIKSLSFSNGWWYRKWSFCVFTNVSRIKPKICHSICFKFYIQFNFYLHVYPLIRSASQLSQY